MYSYVCIRILHTHALHMYVRRRHVDISPCCFVPFFHHPPVAGVQTCYAMDCFCTCDDVSATEGWTASVHTSHMSKPVYNVTRVQSATEWTASVHMSHQSVPIGQ